jgi:hypothetical protein
VCTHPSLLPEYAPVEDNDETIEDTATGNTSTSSGSASITASSGKLRLLMQLLPALRASGHRVLVVSQSQKVPSCARKLPWYPSSCIVALEPHHVVALWLLRLFCQGRCTEGFPDAAFKTLHQPVHPYKAPHASSPLAAHTMCVLCHDKSHSCFVIAMQALDTIQEALTADQGSDSFERIDGSTPSIQRYAAVKRFQKADTTSWCATCPIVARSSSGFRAACQHLNATLRTSLISCVL